MTAGKRDPLAPFAGRQRVRASGLVLDAAAGLLLVEHSGIWDGDPFWTPPGGEVRFGETLGDALVREVREETGLDVEVGPLRYVLDFVRPPLHAVSFYFECAAAGGALRPGADPELPDQLVMDARFVPWDEIAGLRVYPEGLAAWLAEDVPAGFPRGIRYMGPLR